MHTGRYSSGEYCFGLLDGIAAASVKSLYVVVKNLRGILFRGRLG